MHLLLDVEAVHRVIGAPPASSGLQKRQHLVVHLDAKNTGIGRDVNLTMTPKHWRQKNLWRVSLDDLEKFADALGCSKWEISRVEIGGRLFRHAIPERERKAPPIPESESSDSEGDEISLDEGCDWVEDLRRGHDPHVARG